MYPLCRVFLFTAESCVNIHVSSIWTCFELNAPAMSSSASLAIRLRKGSRASASIFQLKGGKVKTLCLYHLLGFDGWWWKKKGENREERDIWPILSHRSRLTWDLKENRRTSGRSFPWQRRSVKLSCKWLNSSQIWSRVLMMWRLRLELWGLFQMKSHV